MSWFVFFFSVNILWKVILTWLWHSTEPPGKIPHSFVTSVRCNTFAAAPLGKNYHFHCKDGRLREANWLDWGWRSKSWSKLTLGLGPALNPLDKAACRAIETSVAGRRLRWPLHRKQLAGRELGTALVTLVSAWMALPPWSHELPVLSSPKIKGYFGCGHSDP